MFNKILILVLMLGFTIGLKADELEINPDHPEKYVVVKGDTLWDISARFLIQPWRWPEIWNVNPQIDNPHLIYPGDIIALSYQNGRPVLNIERGTGRIVSGRNVKLSPSIRSSKNVEAIPTIPIDAIQQFLKRTLVLDDDEINKWPYVVSSYDGHLVAATGNTIYIRGIDENTKTKRYSIYRKGNTYVNPKSDTDEEEILGYEAIYVGDAVLQKKGDPASAVVTVIDREVMIGDRLLPLSDENVSTEFIPHSPDIEVEGNILSVVDGVTQVGQYQIIVLNLGGDQGVEPGNVLGIYQDGYIVQDTIGPNIQKSMKEKAAERKEIVEKGTILTKLYYGIKEKFELFDKTFPTIANKQAKKENVSLPEEYVGVAMVFQSFKKVSYALVMETRGAIHVLDTVRSL